MLSEGGKSQFLNNSTFMLRDFLSFIVLVQAICMETESSSIHQHYFSLCSCSRLFGDVTVGRRGDGCVWQEYRMSSYKHHFPWQAWKQNDAWIFLQLSGLASNCKLCPSLFFFLSNQTKKDSFRKHETLGTPGNLLELFSLQHALVPLPGRGGRALLNWVTPVLGQVP